MDLSSLGEPSSAAKSIFNCQRSSGGWPSGSAFFASYNRLSFLFCRPNWHCGDTVSILKALEKHNQTHRRKQPRKPSFVPVDYTVGDRAFKDFIKNISAGGVFIETRTPFSVGQEISMTFSSAKLDEPIKIRGTIFWANNMLGIGVKFTTENQALVAMLQAL